MRMLFNRPIYLDSHLCIGKNYLLNLSQRFALIRRIFTVDIPFVLFKCKYFESIKNKSNNLI